MRDDTRIRLLTADVDRFCSEDRVTGQVLDEGMRAAWSKSWGLRRIGNVAGLCRERVSYRLARNGTPHRGI